MANQDAWDTGWAMGSGASKKKTAAKKSGGKGGTGSDANEPRGLMDPTTTFQGAFGGFKKKGGPIKKTALYMLHKGEYVVPAQHRGTKKTTRKKTITKR